MRQIAFLFSSLILMAGMASCNEIVWPDDEDGILNQELVTRTADGLEIKTKNKLVVGDEAFPIGSVFVGGGIADPSKGSSHRCHFYSGAFEEGPNWDKVNAMIYIGGFRHTGTEYTLPGQFIDLICIALDPSLGLGEALTIPMDQGNYKGGCDQVKAVKINSYQFSTYQEDLYTINDDGKIDIRILTNDGRKISILFAGKTPYDGYY